MDYNSFKTVLKELYNNGVRKSTAIETIVVLGYSAYVLMQHSIVIKKTKKSLAEKIVLAKNGSV